MDEAGRDEVFSWIDIFEERKKELEEKIKSLDEKYEKEIYKLKTSLLVTTQIQFYERELLLILLTILMRDEGKLENLTPFFTSLKKRNEAVKEIPEGVAIFVAIPEEIMDVVIERVSSWNIGYDQFFSYIIEQVGKVEAKKLLKKRNNT